LRQKEEDGAIWGEMCPGFSSKNLEREVCSKSNPLMFRIIEKRTGREKFSDGPKNRTKNKTGVQTEMKK